MCIAFDGDTAAREALRLGGRRAYAIDGWLGQAQGFYDNLAQNGGLLQAIAGYGVTPEARQSTEHRNAVLGALAEWMSEARKLARLVLEGQPQKLDELDILAPSA